MADKFILFTNLQSVTIGDVRTFTKALLLQDLTITNRQLRVRGFGTGPSWETFDIFLRDSIDYELTGIHHLHVYTSYKLTLEDGLELELATMDTDRPGDVQTFEGVPVTDVWEVLKRKVPFYWNCPNMPTLAWLPAETVRKVV